MHWRSLTLLTLILAPPALCDRSQKPPGKDAILLSNVKTLTLRANRQTTSRRVSPIPQLNCVGPSKKICDLYQIDTMRCTNDGYDYDAEDVQWTCTAALPSEFKLGSTDVICEGYRSSEDKWVLKGSCGVEYRMLLTDQGEKRFGKPSDDYEWSSLFGNGKKTSGRGWRKWVETLGDTLFFGFFAAVFLFIVGRFLSECLGLQRNQRGRTAAGRRWGWGGGGGGGGGRGDDYYPGPPPPYSSACNDESPSFSFGSRSATQGWRPGFWTGALGGAAAGYEMGRRAGNNNRGSFQRGGSFFGRQNNYDAGEGSSRTQSSPSFSTASTSTGFGSTRRR
ncbi:Store-operated calcium entry-associated regulatory factor [Penicillium rolfsii]|nr:Store-operated calcium entry-associated regulatory factor [Penicillium rolfsii]